MSIPLLKRRFSVEEYRRMAQAGILSEDDRVELIEGDVVEMVPIGKRHAACVARLTALLAPLRDRAIVWIQNPIRLGPFSEPQPDAVLLRPRRDFYAQGLPEPQDALLVIEVAETSGDYDRAIKAPLYARARIPEAWIVDLQQEIVDVFRDASVEGYRTRRTWRRGERLSPEAFPNLIVALDELLG